MNSQDKYVQHIINETTGEVVAVNKVYTVEDNIKTQKIIDKRKSQDEYSRYVDEHLGNFYFLFYKLIKKGIPKQYVIRFLYLCCYMEYDTNKLIFGSQKDNGRYMTTKDLQEVLKLSRAETTNTKDSLIKHGLLIKNESDRLVINKKYCIKGSVKNKKTKDMVKIFISGIKELYEKAKPNEHKKLHILIEILPYINIKYNIVCTNTDCEMKKELNPLSLKEFCKIVGYSSKHSSRLKSDLLKLTINKEYVFKFNETGEGRYIEVNPHVYYKGNIKHFDTLQHIVESFDVKGGF